MRLAIRVVFICALLVALFTSSDAAKSKRKGNKGPKIVAVDAETEVVVPTVIDTNVIDPEPVGKGGDDAVTKEPTITDAIVEESVPAPEATIKKHDFGTPTAKKVVEQVPATTFRKFLFIYRGFLHALRDSLDSYYRSENYKTAFHRGPYEMGFNGETEEEKNLRINTRNLIMDYLEESGWQEFFDAYPFLVRNGATCLVGLVVFIILMITRIATHKIVLFFEKKRIAKIKAAKAMEQAEKGEVPEKAEVKEKDSVSKKDD